MLKRLRSRKVMKRVMQWTLILVIPSFVFFYGWQSSANRRQYARQSIAQIKDRLWGLRWRSISPTEQILARELLLRRYANMLQSQGLKVSGEDLSGLVSQRDVAREAIDDYYLMKFAREKGLSVTDDEIRSILEQMYPVRPKESFRQDLRRMRKTEEEFISELAYRQLLAKAEGLIRLRAKASLFELWQEYLIGQEKIQIRYARIPSKDFEAKVHPTTETLRRYYQEHAEDYRIGDRWEFRYVAIFRNEIMKEVEPTTDSIKAFYEKHKNDLFYRRRSVQVRHIFLKVAPDAPTSVVKAVEAKIRKIAEQIKAGADFAEMADRYTEDTDNVDRRDPNKKYGGLLPYPITENARVPFGDEFKKVALSLKEDEVSSPVRGTQGFHLIKVEHITPEGPMTFEEAKDDARRFLKSELADREFRKRGEALKKLITERSFSTLDSLAKAANLPIGDTGLVDIESGYLPKIGSIRDYLDIIKDLSEGEFTEGVLKNLGAYYVLELKRKVPSHIPSFEEIADDVRDDYVTSQAAHLAHEVAIEIARKAKTLDDLQRLAEEKGYKIVATEPFTRDRASRILPNLDPRFTYATLRYKVGSIHVTTQGDPERPVAYIVWYFEKREPPSLEQFRKDLPSVQAEYLSQIQQALVEEWLYDMRKRIPAKINPMLEERTTGREKSAKAGRSG